MKLALRKLPGWCWQGLALALSLAGSSVLAQGTIVHVQLSTPNPDPNFPWDFQGMRLTGLNPQSYNLDFDGDGTAEYVIYASGPNSTRGFEMWGGGSESRVELPSDRNVVCCRDELGRRDWAEPDASSVRVVSNTVLSV